MNQELLTKSIRCEIDFTVAIHDLFPIKATETTDFHRIMYDAMHKLQDELPAQKFKEFGKLVGVEMNKMYPDNETFAISPRGDMDTDRNDRYNFVKLFKENEHPHPFYIDELFIELMTSLIKDNIKNAVLELYSFAGSMPVAGQVYGLYAYERYFKKIFKEYKQLHNIVPGAYYYLKEIYYNEHANCDPDWPSDYGIFDLRFCRYDTGDIF